jgi:PAS domain S-box-containing protein
MRPGSRESNGSASAVRTARGAKKRRKAPEQAVAPVELGDNAAKPRYPFLEITSDSVFIVDPDWRITFINQRARACIARGRDLLGANLWEAFPEAVGTAFQQHYETVMRERNAVEFEALFEPWDAWFQVRAYPVREGVMVLFRDITERQRTQEALRESELRFRTLADTVPEILFAADADGRTDYTNRRFCEYTGLSIDEALGYGWTNVMHPDDLQESLARWRTSLESGCVYDVQCRIRRHDGIWRWFVCRGTPIRDESGAVVRWFGVCTDIDSERQATDALRESEIAIRRLLDAAPHGIVACDRTGRVAMFNDVASHMFGYDPAEILGRSIDILLPAHIRERHSKYRADYACQEHSRMMGRGLDVLACRKDRTQFPVEVSLSCVPSNAGELLVAFIADMSAREEAEELHRANEALLRTNEELERFASQVSHDLREPLATIRSYADLALEVHHDVLPREVTRALTIVQDSADRMAELVSDLLGYARVGGRGGQQLQPADMADALATAVTNLGSAIRTSGAQITHDALPTLPADRVQMVQLFQNLIGNAIKYRGPEPPRIHVSAVFEDGIWLVSVQDNGEGFAPEYAEDIFHPFQRLHGDDIPGTGIGLATCRKIIEAHGGHIWAESQRGSGAIFRFTLPLPVGAATE